MSAHTTDSASGWGFAAVTTVCALAAIAAGLGAGTWLAVAGLTADLAVTARTIVKALAVVGMAGDLVFMTGVARRLYAAYEAGDDE
jgi:hypothetical protein